MSHSDADVTGLDDFHLWPTQTIGRKFVAQWSTSLSHSDGSSPCQHVGRLASSSFAEAHGAGLHYIRREGQMKVNADPYRWYALEYPLIRLAIAHTCTTCTPKINEAAA